MMCGRISLIGGSEGEGLREEREEMEGGLAHLRPESQVVVRVDLKGNGRVAVGRLQGNART
jgi:hypothetical protein